MSIHTGLSLFLTCSAYVGFSSTDRRHAQSLAYVYSRENPDDAHIIEELHSGGRSSLSCTCCRMGRAAALNCA